MMFAPNMMKVMCLTRTGHSQNALQEIKFVESSNTTGGAGNMKLEISNNRTVSDIQDDFTNQFPFLKLEFYKVEKHDASPPIKKHLPGSTPLRGAGLRSDGFFDINHEMTVGELEKIFAEQFGLLAQVSRNSGGVWLETKMTNNWSLHKQNEYGKEISNPANRDFPQR
jgi:hypothetical protein